MIEKLLAVATAIVPLALGGGWAHAAELAVLSNGGKTLSVVDTESAKVLRSVDPGSADPLTTIAVNSVEKEIWGVTAGLKLKRFDYDTIELLFESPVLDVEAGGGKILYCTDQNVYCNLIVNRKTVVALNEEGTVLVSADLPRAAYQAARPRLIGFGAVVAAGSEPRLHAIDGASNAVVQLPPAKDNPKWRFVAELSKTVEAPLAFDTLREEGETRGYAIVGATLYSLNLRNGRLTKPRPIRGLKRDARSMAFYVPAPSARGR